LFCILVKFIDICKLIVCGKEEVLLGLRILDLCLSDIGKMRMSCFVQLFGLHIFGGVHKYERKKGVFVPAENERVPE